MHLKNTDEISRLNAKYNSAIQTSQEDIRLINDINSQRIAEKDLSLARSQERTRILDIKLCDVKKKYIAKKESMVVREEKYRDDITRVQDANRKEFDAYIEGLQVKIEYKDIKIK